MTSAPKDLVVPGSQLLLAVLAAILGIYAPVAGAAASATVAVADAVNAAKERQNRRKSERLNRVVNDLCNRVRDIESSLSADDDRIDLFFEVAKKAVDDDEDRKTVFYSAILEWILRKKPPLSQVRVLSDAVRTMSFVELSYFIFTCNGRNARPFLERELPESIAKSRLSSVGIREGAIVQVNGGATKLGQVLIDFCSINDVFQLLAPEEQRLL